MKTKLLFILGLFIVCIFFSFYKINQPELKEITLANSATYLVEIADTPQKAEQGLMYRKSMPGNQGMLFIFPYPSIIKMWMKNTYIPLDMIFFNAENQAICLHENAHPLDESIITCPYPVTKVLELNAGEIKAKNIQLGNLLFMK